MRKSALILGLMLMAGAAARAEVTLPNILGNGMVLQRNKPVPVWGTAAQGEKVTVKFGKQTKTAMPDTAGHWQVLLDPMQASAKGQTMTISGTNTIKLDDILVGEVWLASGQSNMTYEMRKNSKVQKPDSTSNWPVDELKYAHNHMLRIFLVTNKNLRKPDTTHAGWAVAENAALSNFSAVGYFFAKHLNEDLKVPVGIIASSSPGSRIEPWVSREALVNEPYFKENNIRVDGDPGKFYDNMIQPLAPFAIKGILWYQGESGAYLNENITYAYKMDALINNWRTLWSDKKLPFYYVQIAPFRYSTVKDPVKKYTIYTEPELREGQAQALKIPYTGMVVTTDLNENLDNLHPHYKWEIGRRLELQAMANTYGAKNVVPSGPLYSGMATSGNKIVLSFKYTDGGLISHDGKPLTNFEIAGSDGVFVPAQAEIKGDKVYVSAASVSQPTAARFAWDEAANPNFYNKAGLPAVPFRTNTPYVFKPITN
ncbi:sialate O-acetylesterase [Mucilaginibacter yixingensis]|uniref:Sialate O-acetylesterase n=1 Tax=Mucilaginibacter yixingensis TaxID=1295612 RepID=A0A2T5J8F3_9SPHI|nr:sialate O-acetylesterase [Mucilaginibacter yixingensis]PTQ95743.1 sialate O-acetylesterase [Mucilaginibacter yixingensis]